MDLDVMLRVDRCRDMDELINFWARSRLESGCRNGEPDCFLRYRENPTYTYWPLQRGVVLKWFYGPPLQLRVVLQWFYSLSRRNTFVGGICAPPSALLVKPLRFVSVLQLKKRMSACLKWDVNCVESSYLVRVSASATSSSVVGLLQLLTIFWVAWW